MVDPLDFARSRPFDPSMLLGAGLLRVNLEEDRKVERRKNYGARQLSRDLGVSFAEIARNLGVGTSAIAKAMRDA
jgi:hypothetical protein